MKKRIAVFTMLMGTVLPTLTAIARADVIYDPIGDLVGSLDLSLIIWILLGVSVVITLALLVLKKFRK